METNRIKERLLKMYRLANDGVDGEKETAQKMLEANLAKCREKKFIENLTQSERERYKKLGIPLAVAAKFEVRPETNIPIPTSDCHGYQIACLCGKECPKFNEAYELGVRDDECAIFDEIMEEIKLKEK